MRSIDLLPLGDSITKGEHSPGSGGYRGYLPVPFLGLSCQPRMVGSQTDADPAVAAVTGHHEGHDGWMLSDAMANLPTILAATPCQVALVMLGTNDLIGPLATNATRAAAQNNLTLLLNQFATLSPATLVIMGTIPTIGPQYPMGATWAAAYNDTLHVAVSAQRAAGHLAYCAETGAAIGPNLFDGVHPTDLGYSVLALEWIKILRGVLPLLG